MDNLEQQKDEVQAMSSIYGDEFVLEEFTSDYQVYSMEFTNDSKTIELKLTVKLFPSYPSESSPTYELSSPYLNGLSRATLGQQIEQIFAENIGQPVLYQCFEEVRNFISQFNEDAPINANHQNDSPETTKEIDSSKKTFVFTTCEPIVDRKSTFQGHVTEVTSKQDVSIALQQLKLNTKIERATHNMYAYRIHDGNVWIQDCDDDGESQAGSRLLHLLQVLEAKNVLVIVSRWFGGTQLGATRFKHINNAARAALDKNGNVTKGKKA
ncbi:Protein IMPACT-A [Pseudolycoriella hygida]|uniref:Protein IMPACT-A n=1 Tax=Pseudolycoriella hygida TaxID=35572 RepID=A0A9Q0RXX7_9DIPT|nr:Protein IMPACT-A [Pseudolycoriella hygida]